MTWIAVPRVKLAKKLVNGNAVEWNVYREDANGWLIYELPRPPRRPQPHKKKTRNGKKHRKRFV